MKKKILAIWAHPYLINPDTKNLEDTFKRTFNTLAESGVSQYLPFVAEDGKAFYQTDLLDTKIDYMSIILKVAAEYNIDVFPLFGFGRIAAMSPKWRYRATAPKETMELPACVDHSLCASWPDAQDALVAVIDDVLTNYSDLPGIQLDYFRYPNSDFQSEFPCECEACQERRIPWLGHGKLTLEDRQKPGIMYKEIRQKHDIIYGTLKRIHKVVKDKHNKKLSLAARARFYKDAMFEGQDWHRFVMEGYFDYICPMSYNQCEDRFRRFLDEHTHLTKDAPVKYLASVGKKSSLSDLSTKDFIKQIMMALERDVDGISIFSHKGMTDADFQALKKLAKYFTQAAPKKRELVTA